MRHVEPAMNLIQKGETQLLDAASTGGKYASVPAILYAAYFLISLLRALS